MSVARRESGRTPINPVTVSIEFDCWAPFRGSGANLATPAVLHTTDESRPKCLIPDQLVTMASGGSLKGRSARVGGARAGARFLDTPAGFEHYWVVPGSGTVVERPLPAQATGGVGQRGPVRVGRRIEAPESGRDRSTPYRVRAVRSPN